MTDTLEGAAGINDEEATLVERAKEGDRAAFETLLRRHQPWVYNIALRMTGDPVAAEDITQECLIKVVTRLSTFRGTSRLRTWLYRIVANHVINMKRRPRERVFASFDHHADILDGMTDHEPSTEELRTAEELKVSCLMGMLLCLDREERFVFIIGGIFGVSDAMGSEILETSRAAYRQKLSRARRQLLGFMNGRCGLLDPANPCRCPKKTRAAIRAGYIDPENLEFDRDYVAKVTSFVRAAQERMTDDSIAMCQSLFLETPFQEPPDLTGQITKLMESENFARLMNFRC